MKRTRIRSTSLESVGYEAATETLEVEFAGGAVYQYLEVPEVELRRFMRARSRGAYLNRHIKPHFLCRPIASQRTAH
jgi:KTSC domain